jgi:hypothetical protein
MKTRFFWLIGAVLAMLLLSAQTAVAQAQPGVTILNSLAKPSPTPPDARFLARFEAAPVIHAAWGESEALQILVSAPEGGLLRLRASCGDFAHSSGDVWDAGTVWAKFVGYVRTKEPYYGTLRVGEWPDPILPDKEVFVPGGRVQPIWVEVTVPEDSEPGRYQGEVVLEAEGWRQSVPLEVMVWGFTMSVEPILPSSFLLFPRFVYQYHKLERGSPQAEVMLRLYHESMLAHKIMPTHVAMDAVQTRPRLNITEAGELRAANFQAFDMQIDWAMSQGQTVFGLEGPRKVNPHSATWYRVVGEHLAERGWLDHFYTYLFDETYEGVAEMTALVHGSAPDLKNLITRMPSDDYPDVDWWCPRLGDAMMRADEVDAWLGAQGLDRSDLWVYTAGNAGSDVPALHLDVDGIEARMTPLTVWKEGYGGFLFWCVNYWTVNPWEDPMVFPRQNGNGALYYPGGVAGPVESIRLKMLRDGFDDLDYATQLRYSSHPEAARVLAELPVHSALDWERDPQALLTWRLEAGYLLSGNAIEASWVQQRDQARARAAEAGHPVTKPGDPDSGWHGARDMKNVDREDGSRALRFTLDADKSKLWRIPGPRDWRPYGEVVVEIELIEGPPTRLNMKLGTGLIRRHSWVWEIHLAPGAKRRVRIPIPHERLNTESLTELNLFLWEPDAPRRFELSGIWLK